MIITIKNLQQQTFTVEFEQERTVLDLKRKIFSERGPEYLVEKQKLIYAGVILDDERTITSYNVDEKKFIVVMLKRDIGAPAQKPDESGEKTTRMETTNSTSTNSASSGRPAVASVLKKPAGGDAGTDEDAKSVGSSGSGGSGSGGGAVLGPVASNTSILSTTSGASERSGNSIGSGNSETSRSSFSSGDLAGVFSNTSLQSRAESNLLMGEEYNRSVESMIEMGYARDVVERAMAASFNNPERAVEYLISGIPDNEDGFNATSAAAALLLQGGGGAGGAGGVGGGVVAGGEAVSQSAGEDNRTRAGVNTSRSDVGGDVTIDERNVGGSSTVGERNPQEDPFEFLRSQPQFLQMRSLVYQNPDLLHAVLQQIAQTNPALLQLISENQDAFLSMLNQPEDQTGSPQYPRRMTPGRRAQLAAATRASAGGDGLHIRTLDTAPGAGGDGPSLRQGPAESGDAGADVIPQDQSEERAAERRAAVADAFMRDRAAAAAAVAELTAAASLAVDRDVGAGEGGGTGTGIGTGTGTGTGSGGVGVGGGGGGQRREVISAESSNVAGEEESVATIRLTSHDRDAIERLKALGFPELLVLQAYFACDKDEQLAANFLVTTAFDE